MSMFRRGKSVPIMFVGDSVKVRSRTHQSFAKDADINVIMSRYKKTGVLVDPMLVNSSRRPRFGNFADIPDYSLMLGRMQQAQVDFLSLPSNLRARFHNDVAECLDFIADPSNLKEAVSLGLVPKDHPVYVELLAQEKALADAENVVKDTNPPEGGSAPNGAQ